MSILASIVVDFGDLKEASYPVAVELDSVRNKDKNTFEPEDLCWFYVFAPSNVELDLPKSSAGSVTLYGTKTLQKDEIITFTTDLTQSTKYEPVDIPVLSWWGNIPSVNVAGGVFTLAEDIVPCVGRVSYNTVANLYFLTPPAMELVAGEEFPIVVLISGKVL